MVRRKKKKKKKLELKADLITFEFLLQRKYMKIKGKEKKSFKFEKNIRISALLEIVLQILVYCEITNRKHIRYEILTCFVFLSFLVVYNQKKENFLVVYSCFVG